MRDDFSNEDKEIMAKRVGYRCSNPDCRKLTTGPQKNSRKTVNVGVAAHITAASKGGPRFDRTLTIKQRKDLSNGIWLCQTCAKLIDNDESLYTVKLLHFWRECSEAMAHSEIQSGTDAVLTVKFILEQDYIFYSKYGDIRKLYVKVDIHDDVIEDLQNYYIVIITGLPKIGKTFLMKAIGLDLRENGYKIMEVKDPVDIKYDFGIKQLFLCDDFIGETSLDFSKLNRWKKSWEEVTKKKDVNHLFLCTSRAVILKESRKDIEDKFDLGSITEIHLDIFDPEIKEAILERQIQYSKINTSKEFQNRKKLLNNIKERIILMDSFFPEDIRLLCWQVIPDLNESVTPEDFNESVFGFFNRTNTYLMEEISRLKLNELIILLIIYSEKCTTYTDVKQEYLNHCNDIPAASDLVSPFCPQLFTEMMENLGDVYISWMDYYWIGFIHPCIKESVKIVINSDRRWLKYMKIIGGEILLKDILQNPIFSQEEKNEAMKDIVNREISKKLDTDLGQYRNFENYLDDLKNLLKVLVLIKERNFNILDETLQEKQGLLLKDLKKKIETMRKQFYNQNNIEQINFFNEYGKDLALTLENFGFTFKKIKVFTLDSWF